MPGGAPQPPSPSPSGAKTSAPSGPGSLAYQGLISCARFAEYDPFCLGADGGQHDDDNRHRSGDQRESEAVIIAVMYRNGDLKRGSPGARRNAIPSLRSGLSGLEGLEFMGRRL